MRNGREEGILERDIALYREKCEVWEADCDE